MSIEREHDEAQEVERIYQRYLDEVSGEAPKRRDLRRLDEEDRAREEEWRRHSEETGSPLPRNYQ